MFTGTINSLHEQALNFSFWFPLGTGIITFVQVGGKPGSYRKTTILKNHIKNEFRQFSLFILSILLRFSNICHF